MEIAEHLPNIITLVRNNIAILVVAPPGSGKTIGIPFALNTVGARCFAAVPTRTAAKSLYEYQKTLQPDPNIVGYAAEGNIQYNESSKIVYATSGHIRKKLLSYFRDDGTPPNVDFCDVLLVDEVHAGSIDSTVILGLWLLLLYIREEALKTNANIIFNIPRLIVASATPIPLSIHIGAVPYKVEIKRHHIEHIYQKTPMDFDNLSLLHKETANVIKEYHKQLPIEHNHMLVFTSGKKEVDSIMAELKKLLLNDTTAIIIPAHGSLSSEEINKIYSEFNGRKIIISTNIAEMSITIKDIGIVIDTMLEKRTETSQSEGLRLTTHLISKDSAEQRAGRTGRTRPGICHRMCTLDQFNNLEHHRPLEINRIPIHHVILELLERGLDPSFILQDVNITTINKSIGTLRKYNLITPQNKITDKGVFVNKFPIAIKSAIFLFDWAEQYSKILFPGLIVASIINCYGPSYYWIPRKDSSQNNNTYNLEIAAHKNKYFGKFKGYNDLETALRFWIDLTTFIKTNNESITNPSPRIVSLWSVQNSMNNKKIRELLKTVKQCLDVFRREGYMVQTGNFNPLNVVNAARPILYKVYDTEILAQKRGAIYLDIHTKLSYKLDTKEAVNDFSSKYPPGVISIINIEFKNQNENFRVSSFSVDTDVDYKFISDTPDVQNEISLDMQWPIPNEILRKFNINDVVAYFRDSKMPFPYKFSYRPIQDMYASYSNLLTMNPQLQEEPYTVKERFIIPISLQFRFNPAEEHRYLSVKRLPEDQIDWIVDYFIEPQRMKCLRLSNTPKITPHDAWYAYGPYVEDTIKLVSDSNLELSLPNLRNAIQVNNFIKACPHESVYFISSILKFLNLGSISLFDVNAEWGDRLISSIASNVYEYYSINSNYKEEFVDMALTLCKVTEPNVTFDEIANRYFISDVNVLPETKYNSFDVSYFSITTLNLKEWGTEENWYANYVFPYIDMCWNALKDDGYFIIHTLFISKIAIYIYNKYDNAFLCGPISEIKEDDIKTTWIWKKTVEHFDTNIKQSAVNAYPTMFAKKPHVNHRDNFKPLRNNHPNYPKNRTRHEGSTVYNQSYNPNRPIPQRDATAHPSNNSMSVTH